MVFSYPPSGSAPALSGGRMLARAVTFTKTYPKAFFVV